MWKSIGRQQLTLKNPFLDLVSRFKVAIKYSCLWYYHSCNKNLLIPCITHLNNHYRLRGLCKHYFFVQFGALDFQNSAYDKITVVWSIFYRLGKRLDTWSSRLFMKIFSAEWQKNMNHKLFNGSWKRHTLTPLICTRSNGGYSTLAAHEFKDITCVRMKLCMLHCAHYRGHSSTFYCQFMNSIFLRSLSFRKSSLNHELSLEHVYGVRKEILKLLPHTILYSSLMRFSHFPFCTIFFMNGPPCNELYVNWENC